MDYNRRCYDNRGRAVSDLLSEQDEANAAAQRSVHEHFDLDLSVPWQWAAGSRRYLTLTHLYHSPYR